MAEGTRRRTPASPKRRPSASETSDRTGYGKPPREHQFRPGQSGNSKGRPRGAKNTATLLREILDRRIEVRSGNTIRKITVREAMLTRFAESALKGDTKSAAFLLQRYDSGEAAQEHADNPITVEEQEIIDRYVQAYQKRQGVKK
jgi:hypothetical protein